MSNLLPSIDLELSTKLKDPNYRQAFFLAETSALIAKQLLKLRKRRGLNQAQVAKLLNTGQPAISRVERADYRNWSFNTLRRLADAMDARLRVVIEPAEDVLYEYEPRKFPTQVPLPQRENPDKPVSAMSQFQAAPSAAVATDTLATRPFNEGSAATVGFSYSQESQLKLPESLTFPQYNTMKSAGQNASYPERGVAWN